MIRSLHDAQKIAEILRRNSAMNLYALGDLDPFHLDYTIWYGLGDKAKVESIALLYLEPRPPTLLLLDGSPTARDHLRLLQPLLPERFQAHLHPSLADALAPRFRLLSNETHLKMALVNPAMVRSAPCEDAVRLGRAQQEEVDALLRASYPDNHFTARMLETGQYFGIYVERQLVSVAGVHVYSPHYHVAALGNISTHPDFRNRGLARQCSAAVCQSLLKQVDVIGLNVHPENRGAIHCYETLGFRLIADYIEVLAEAV
ncbi:MAG: GNAT family N-acetyltransferase [Myxococcales bacterium]|nr:GNAT family N-acetyltransferase [Myxococcales bacterium]